MKNHFRQYKSLFLIFFLFFSAISVPSFAMTIGRDGDPYEENGVLWQPVKFEENNRGFKAEFPGKPMSGISTPWYYISSSFGLSEYEIHTHMSDRYELPKNETQFNDILLTLVENNEMYTILKPSNHAVRYEAEVLTRDLNTGNHTKIWRLYWTSDERVYIAIVEGDISSSAQFFNKIRFVSH